VLKITTIETDGQRKLLLEGKLVEPWITEFKKAWQEANQSLGGKKLLVDLANVTVIGEQGECALFEMMRQGTQFNCSGILNKHVLHQLARKCKQ
jgi:hypothetical protein